MQAGLGGLADHRPGELGDEHGGGEGQQRRQQRAEDNEQQRQDEQDGQVLAQVARLLGGLAGVGLGGQRAGQVGAQITGQCAGSDGVPEAGREVLGGALGVEVDVGQDPGARYLPGGGRADETDLHSPYRQLTRHARHARGARAAPASVELPIGCPARLRL